MAARRRGGKRKGNVALVPKVPPTRTYVAAVRCVRHSGGRVGSPEDFRYVSIYYVITLPRAQNGAANGARGMRGCGIGCETGKRSAPLAQRCTSPRVPAVRPPSSRTGYTEARPGTTETATMTLIICERREMM